MANQFIIKNGLTVQQGGINVTGSLTLSDDLIVQGSITAQSYIVSSSVTHMTTSFSSGSTIFGDDNSDTHQFTGSLSISSTLNLDSVVNANTDTDKFLVLDSNGNVDFRTGTEVRSDIGATAPQNLQSVTSVGSSTTDSITMANFVISNPTNNNAGSDKILVLDAANRSKIRTRDELRSDIGALQATKTPQMVVTAAEVLDEATTDVYIPFSGINIFPETNEVAYSRFHAPYDGYIKEIIVHPHSTATSGTCTITPIIDGSTLTGVQETISGTAGTPTTFSFGTPGYGFDDGDDIVLAFDRESNDRSSGFSFTIVFIMDTTS
jgi:hypothetical protein